MADWGIKVETKLNKIRKQNLAHFDIKDQVEKLRAANIQQHEQIMRLRIVAIDLAEELKKSLNFYTDSPDARYALQNLSDLLKEGV